MGSGHKHYSGRGQWRSRIKNARPIHDRPAEAEDRTVQGHSEGDLIIGGTNSRIATLVDRASRKVDVVQLADRSVKHLTMALSKRRAQQPHVLAKTLTWDRGMESADHQTITKTTGVE